MRDVGENDALAGRLVAFIAEREGLPEADVGVENLRRMAGGASRLLYALDVVLGERRLELVLRQDPPGRSLAGRIELEFELMQAAAAAGVPVPRVLWCAPDAAALGAPGFAMERLAGEAIPRRLHRDPQYAAARAGLTAQLGEILAAIHRIDSEAPGLAGRLACPPPGRTPAAAELDRLVLGYRGLALEPHPVLDLAERWLRPRAPQPARPGLVHGDYRIGNVLFDEKGAVAILDWELAHVGDPAEDLAWMCLRAWRFGRVDLAAGGIGTREALLRAYEAAGGAAVDPAALAWWEACGNFKLALVFIGQARAYLDGAHRTVELAALGRRTAEAEAELVRIMEAGA